MATIANITVLLVYYGFSPPSQKNWAIAMILLMMLMAYFITRKYKDIAISLVMVWALIGIIIKKADANLLLRPLVLTSVLTTKFIHYFRLSFSFILR